MFPLLSRAAAVAMAAAITIGSAGLAAADHGGGGSDVRREGSCSGSAHWKLKVKPDDGRLAVEVEIDSNRRGQVWSWRILHDGFTSYRGNRTTRAPSGSFSVERRVVDMSGSDLIGLRAKNSATGQTCRGHLAY
ncbi:MAG TPA: hypothetical protein VLK34_09205 [Nocardioidaceae bacterium]|nr:hypothetical protein [Nocardioidaceae bacterium]